MVTILKRNDFLNFLTMKSYIFIFLILITFNSYAFNINKKINVVVPVYETSEVISKGDAADDPAFWLNKEKPSKSLIFGTDKRSGIYTYNLKGEELNYLAIGNINNIDLRTIDIKDDDGNELGPYSFLFGSNRSTNSLDIWVFSDSDITESLNKGNFKIPNQPYISAKSNLKVYGVCAGYDKTFGLIAFLTADESPQVEVWSYGPFGMTLLTTFKNANATQSEGCVYDDENRRLFISEEQDRGILRSYDINDQLDFSSPSIIDDRSGFISGDPEGLTIYKTSLKNGYVLVSSQGDDTFNLYDRSAPHNYLGSFKISHSNDIDGVTDTDGIFAINFDLNEDFPKGLLVAQDGTNDGKYEVEKQNFKLVSFSEILNSLKL